MPAPSPSPFRRYGLTLAVAVGVVILDQLTKWWALENLTRQTIDLFWTLRFRLAFNTGAAFSLGESGGFTRFIPFAALLVVGIVLWQGRTLGSKLGAVALGLILGGAVGNLIDRAFRTGVDGGFLSGAVVDFIDPQWFPIFNVADSGVVIGGFLLVFVSLRMPTDEADGTDETEATGPAEPSGASDADADADDGADRR